MTKLIAIVSALGLGSVLGAWINQYLEDRRERSRLVLERKEKQYRNFLENLIGFYKGWEDEDKKKVFITELYTHAPLYASDQVFKLGVNFLKSLDEKSDFYGKGDLYYKKMVIAIRKDLKKSIIKKTDLCEEDIELLKLNKENEK